VEELQAVLRKLPDDFADAQRLADTVTRGLTAAGFDVAAIASAMRELRAAADALADHQDGALHVFSDSPAHAAGFFGYTLGTDATVDVLDQSDGHGRVLYRVAPKKGGAR
jgi:acyl transferase domain-containing protein